MGVNSITEKKYEILKASLSFPTSKDRDKLLQGFKDVAVQLEENIENEFFSKVKEYHYSTKSLEEEQKRLTQLIDFTNENKLKQDKFLEEFKEVTGISMLGIHRIENDISSIKRLEAINNYYDNTEQIKRLENDISILKTEYEEFITKKENNERINVELEKTLSHSFMSMIKDNSNMVNVDLEDIDFELEKIEYDIGDNKTNLDNFYLAYETLEHGQISKEKKEEYKDYVQEARINYYNSKEKECLLKLYKIISTSVKDYSKLYKKREEIEKLLEERIILRTQLEIVNIDEIKDFYELAREQFNIIKSQQIVIDNLDMIKNKIEDSENKILFLKDKNESVEILSILNEFKIIDTYKIDDDFTDEKILEADALVDYKPNEVIDIKKSSVYDFDNIKSKAIDVMNKVVSELMPNIVPSKIEKENNDEKVNEEDIFASHDEDIFAEPSKENIFNDEVPQEKSEEDDFFSAGEKDVLSNSYEENTNGLEIDIKDEQKREENEYVSDFPSVDKIGTVKPIDTLEEIKEKKEQLSDINIPTNGIVNTSDNGIDIDSRKYLNVGKE